MTRFGAELRALRKAFGLKMVWLASAIGCSDTSITYWETGRSRPTPDHFWRISDVLRGEGATAAQLTRLDESWRASQGLTDRMPMPMPLPLPPAAALPLPHGRRRRRRAKRKPSTQFLRRRSRLATLATAVADAKAKNRARRTVAA